MSSASTKPPRKASKRTDKTRQKLLDAALEVFSARGYDGASLSEITARAELGTGTLYLHFRDKRELYESMVRRELLGVRERWRDERASRGLCELDLTLEVRCLCEVIVDWFLAKPALAKLILFDGPPIETWLVHEVGRVISPVFAARVADPALYAHMVVGALLAAGRYRVSQPRRMSRKKLVDSVTAFCAGGISTRLK